METNFTCIIAFPLDFTVMTAQVGEQYAPALTNPHLCSLVGLRPSVPDSRYVPRETSTCSVLPPQIPGFAGDD